MKVINKLKNTDFIITASFYVCLLFIPAFVQNGSADFSVWTDFFFNRNLNILLCLIPSVLPVFLKKSGIAESSLITAIIDTLILFFIHSDFFVSANYHINLLLAVFILLVILINTNELFSAAGIIPFFFLTKLGLFHYVLTVAVPLIFLLIIKLREDGNKTKKLILKITLFIQCYICVFFVFLLILKRYTLNINVTLPSAVTPNFIIKTVSAILLLICVFVLFIIKNSNRIKTGTIAEKILITAPVIYFVCLGIAGFFTDIISVKNKTTVILAVLYITLFFTQNRLSEPTDRNEKSSSISIIAISAAVLFCLSMLN